MNRGIEVGHIFKLGTKYSEKMKATFLDEDGKEKPVIMGCYGIGIGRTAAAAIEQGSDKDGIIWPLPIAPFQVAVVPVNISEQIQKEVASTIYDKLSEDGIDVLFDDRDDRVGVRLKDIDLIGIPIKVIVGPKGLAENKVEIKLRATGKSEMVAFDEVLEKIKELLAS
jgi:prolyl-tRNA synthetase